ncbi:MAG: bifunctional 4-hydroxy-2-oxoglutarate aldolase/2-dehydro-3-deoxy-phosphogluconate aldolase [Bacteroidales bacterium]|nr:bifunctional 4-hydroxy-2-oxoglutarate aldolase/2-dehydro-3-deoxy-phosphogluconate aldolase [Bacteroidales bacterium]
MAKYKRFRVVETILESGMMPLYYHQQAEVCKKVLEVAYKAGIRVFEFTNRGDFAHEVFAQINQYALNHLPEMVLGVGSVVDAPTASLYMQLGANFIVSPLLNEEIARVCNRRKVLWIPGCGTLSEISKAEELGAEIVKIFPAKQLGGPAFIKSILGPCPWTLIMPSGGVEPEEDNLRQWFSAGAACVGMGSNLFPSELIREEKYNELKNLLEQTFQLVQKIRNQIGKPY